MPSRPWPCARLRVGLAASGFEKSDHRASGPGPEAASARPLPWLTQLNFQGWSWKAKALDTVEECLPSYRYSLFGVSLLFAGMSLKSTYQRTFHPVEDSNNQKKGIISISNALPACTRTHTGKHHASS
uniref:Uncharacterized protein n=1 Tax=Pipistrellus kuhlii TaxID=59472 RepID=A0A7J7VC14_PIPKU|nr:hypothetical protein mPipKuh1_008514 [Pipistrellus kuhlii]